MSSLVALPVVIPLAGAALLLMLGGFLPGSIVRAVTVAVTVTETAVAAVLMHDARSGTIVYWFGGWTPRHGVALGVSFAVDRLGAGAATFVGIIVTAATLTTRRSFGSRVALTHALMLTMLAAMAGFCLTGDIFNLFVFYELIAVSAFGLAAYNNASTPSLRAALNFAITNSIGAFLLLIGIALLYGRTGALNLAQIGSRLAAEPHVDGLVVVAVTTVTVGFLVKAAVVPFHFWLVDTASAGPLPLVLILGGALDSLAVYAIARVYWTAFAPALAGHDRSLQILLLATGAATALVGAVLAVWARGTRRVIAFVLVSHTGTLLVGIGCLSALGVAGAAIYAIADGAIKAALFACVGVRHSDRDEFAPGRFRALLLVAGGLALAGLPVFGISLGESVIAHAASGAGNPWIEPILFAASMLTGAAVMRIGFGALRASRSATDRSRADPVRGQAPELAAVAAALVGVAITARFVFAHWIAGAAATFVASASYRRTVLQGAKVAPAAAISGVRITAGSELLAAASVVGALALVAFTERQQTATLAGTRAPGATSIGNALRRLHGGSPGDSVAWLMVGATAFAAVLAVTLH